jgi:hypothetical protein
MSLVYQPMGQREQVTSGRECRRSVIFDLEGNFLENIAFVRFCEQFGQWEALQTCLPSKLSVFAYVFCDKLRVVARRKIRSGES